MHIILACLDFLFFFVVDIDFVVDEKRKKKLALVINFFNSSYSMGGR